MPEHQHTEDLIDYLDIVGQQPGRDNYIQLSLFYPVTDDSVYPTVVNTLTRGLERLTTGFPWVAGQVVNEGASEGNTGVMKVKTLEKTPRFIIKDHRNSTEVPTMKELRYAGFPIRMLDEKHIAPRRTFPGFPDESHLTDFPVFLVQANFIVGGLILTFNGHHNVMDGTGYGHLVSLLSKACREEPFSAEDIRTGNLSRRNLIPLLEESWQPGSDLDSFLVKANPRPLSPPSPPPRSTYANFSFSAKSLEILKALAVNSLPPSSDFVSTDDALTALIWQSITRVRLPRIDPGTEVKFGRFIDVRRYFNIPATYPGLAANMSFHSWIPEKLVDASLGALASEFRAAVDPKTTKVDYIARALATHLYRSPDKRGISGSASVKLERDVLLTSWAKNNCYDLDFNLGLGKPEAVRRPLFFPIESSVCLLPRSLGGEVIAVICLRDEDMGKLKEDDEFMKFATYIG